MPAQRWIARPAPRRDRAKVNTTTTLSRYDLPPRKQQTSDTESTCPSCQSQQAKLCALARTQERKRIARELHDELGQQLTALQQGLGVLRIHLGQDRPDLLGHIERLTSISHSAIEVIREIHNGAPIKQLQHNLISTLEGLIEEFRQLSEVDCRCNLPKQNFELEPGRAAQLYRIVQESLTNILRHANASRAEVSLERRENDYVLEIFDDGQGFTLSDILPDSTGLSGMRERGKQLGGPVIIFSHPGQGTIVQAIFPVKIHR
ncbi:sensor histidine kinase [Pseudomonas chengduensis]|nr:MULTISPECIES: sensor histidine kinase [Pseudomonas]MBG0846469.1 sensor histidine kinase [Pseudomonas chengduensis]MDH1729462.1 sensor histidine kinase [Pseudomonas chengduensis]WFS18336.1 sensor histidine kinase [Pseudomonas sp. 905_Psudmo1]WKC38558.1 sensor histidine kinase [Pseudomonas chengduensis]